jgi:hypothetical protein
MKKFEFILRINSNIICQRFFAVKNFNSKVSGSMDIIECLNDCVEMVQKQLKLKSLEYLWSQYNPYDKQSDEQINKTSIYDKEDIFDFEIRIDEKVIAARRFTGNVYPQRVRYSVDIRDLIPKVISRIQDTMSQEKFNVEYVTTNH